MVSSWKDANYNEFKTSDTYDDGIQLGALVFLHQQQSKPTYTYVLPKPSISSNTYLSKIDIAVTGLSNESVGVSSGVEIFVGSQKLGELPGEGYTQTTTYTLRGDSSSYLHQEGAVWHLDVTLAAIEDDDWYDLRDITVTYTYQGISGDDLARLAQVTQGITQLDAFSAFHESYLVNSGVASRAIYNAFWAEASQAIAKAYVGGIAALPFGSLWNGLAGKAYGDYIKPYVNNILGWYSWTDAIDVSNWWFNKVAIAAGYPHTYVTNISSDLDSSNSSSATNALEGLENAYYMLLQTMAQSLPMRQEPSTTKSTVPMRP